MRTTGSTEEHGATQRRASERGFTCVPRVPVVEKFKVAATKLELDDRG